LKPPQVRRAGNYKLRQDRKVAAVRRIPSRYVHLGGFMIHSGLSPACLRGQSSSPSTIEA